MDSLKIHPGPPCPTLLCSAGWPTHREGGLQPSSTLLETPRHTPMMIRKLLFIISVSFSFSFSSDNYFGIFTMLSSSANAQCPAGNYSLASSGRGVAASRGILVFRFIKIQVYSYHSYDSRHYDVLVYEPSKRLGDVPLQVRTIFSQGKNRN
jgi:hypothetical protein